MLRRSAIIWSSVLLALVVDFTEAKTTGSYAPTYVDCPSDVEWIREANGLSSKESAWVQGRKRVVANALEKYLTNLDLEDFATSEFIQRISEKDYATVPILSLPSAAAAGDQHMEKTGGLLQALTYTTGLSGGNWPTLSMPLHGFPTIDEITEAWKPWLKRFNVKQNSAHAATDKSIFADIAAKAKAGFNVSMGDYFGREFAYEFIPGKQGGVQTTVSGIAKMESFKNHSMPMPISVATEVLPGDDEYFNLKVPPVDGSAVLYEISPFEFGAWTGPKAFTPTEYVGTRLHNGSVVDSKKCVNGFDNAGFILGTCASAFNFWYIEGLSNGTLAGFSKRSTSSSSIIKRSTASNKLVYIVGKLSKVFKKYFGTSLEESISTPWPNPFHGLKRISSKWEHQKDLEMVDGSETGQAVPFWPLIQPERSPSLIFAWDDDGGETLYGWANGTNLYDTYLAAATARIPFPIIPPVNTILNKGFHLRPTFFGCDTSLTTSGDARAPIVAWMGNAPYSAYSNYTWSQTTFTRRSMQEIYTNVFNLVTQGNGTWDHEWPACLGCATIERTLDRIGMERTAQCDRCFEKYCWNGDFDNTAPEEVDPPMALYPTVSFAEWEKTSKID